MRKVEKFEDLIAWQKAQDIAVFVYEQFRDCKDWGFKNQLCNAAVSISNNVAEGFDRSTDNQFHQFLDFAKGSCGEVKSMTYLAFRFGYLENLKGNTLLKMCDENSRIIYALMKSIKGTS